MPKYYELIESRLRRPRTSRNADLWGAAIAAGIFFALPVLGALYRGSFGGMEVVVAVTGIAILAVVAEGLMYRRRSSHEKPRSTGRDIVCPRSGEPLVRGA